MNTITKIIIENGREIDRHVDDGAQFWQELARYLVNGKICGDRNFKIKRDPNYETGGDIITIIFTGSGFKYVYKY